MYIKKILSSILIAGFLVFTVQTSGEVNSNETTLYHADIKLDKLRLLGFLSISSVKDSIHHHSGHDHHCPVDSCFLGTYHRVVFGNKSGHQFFDLIIRHDTITRLYIGPALRKENVMNKIEELVQELIASIDSQHPKEQLSLSDSTLNLVVRFSFMPGPKPH